ncbi:unnamed protein product [Moneuplotes crassus]|uniref:Uncharacterized protein n=1 Tax=Euplotes crassus TaxID=5936 RepID=A0AAD2D5F0_EUPCR|nr:unnamed protein product [Moneuplotes crassus]
MNSYSIIIVLASLFMHISSEIIKSKRVRNIMLTSLTLYCKVSNFISLKEIKIFTSGSLQRLSDSSI